MSAKSILKDTSIAFLEQYLNNASPTGFEAEGQKIWMDYLKPYVDTFITDTYGTAVGVINPDAPYKVVIEGHSDEISWYVNYITEDGLIYVIRNGGSDHQIAPSHEKRNCERRFWLACHSHSKQR
jgi:putative aminopeptidase FrvX